MVLLASVFYADAGCKTNEMKASWEAGGWSAGYMQRLWDTKGVVATIGLFFPVTSAAAAATWRDEIERQFESFAEVVQELEDDVQQRLVAILQNFMQTGNLDVTSLDRLDLKATLKHVLCGETVNTPCPTITNPFRVCPNYIPTEGYSQIAIGWRLNAEPEPDPPVVVNTCDPVTQPAPHYGMKGGQCLPSCGMIGGTASLSDPCDTRGMIDVGTAYDATYCCKAQQQLRKK
jgi:hypothetical protein